ncbi:hypothetical protein TEA_008006 [Camellia sinensis var. sinensis]|uniref:SUF system FeS cluster assembly SufBD core domain-containing protein n=1 Tax=Camellia sinensis var. sinensis TaxID=542762 RepID=A0A4S4DSH1_CAMSN|nr:hypothetical protein TEA_008006 [Camellia sinensis var. sinensis]
MVQDSYAGDDEGKGEVYNFVTKRGVCAGARSKISWMQLETGSAITWKGLVQVQSRADDAQNFLQCDSMLIGDNAAANTYPYIQNLFNVIQILGETKVRVVFTKHVGICLLLDAVTIPLFKSSYIEFLLISALYFTAIVHTSGKVKNRRANIEHEASISKIGDDQLFYFEQRGIESEKAMAAMISGFGRVVFNELPDEFCTEVKQLMNSKVVGTAKSFAWFDKLWYKFQSTRKKEFKD